MKKLHLGSLFMVITATFSTAFSQGRFSGGFELGLPIGSFSNIANIGFGASVRYEAPIQDKVNWTGTMGFLSFGGESFPSFSYQPFSVIPLQGGLKYYFSESFRGFYVLGELGFSIVSYSTPSNSVFFQKTLPVTATTTKFSFTPGAGYHLGNLDFSACFQVVSDFSYFNIRAAYVFGGR